MFALVLLVMLHQVPTTPPVSIPTVVPMIQRMSLPKMAPVQIHITENITERSI